MFGSEKDSQSVRNFSKPDFLAGRRTSLKIENFFSSSNLTSMPVGERVDISKWRFVGAESRGASVKYWVEEPSEETHWLFKPASIHKNGERQAGDFSELVASLLAERLKVPAATSRLATRDGLEGVVVRNLRPRSHEMYSGGIAMNDAGIEIDFEIARVKQAAMNHTLDNVFFTLREYGPPKGFLSWQACTGFDVFVSYLFLDSLIANTDRHESNWSILRSRLDPEEDTISPAYDMENSMGFQLPDSRIEAMLEERGGVEKFAIKGHAKRFESHAKLPLTSLAADAMTLASDNGKLKLHRLLDAIAQGGFEDTIGNIHGMSEVRRRFMLDLLDINGRRLIDAINDHAR